MTPAFFHRKSANVITFVIKKYRYILHFGTQYLILLTFLEPFLEICLINLVIILMMSAKW